MPVTIISNPTGTNTPVGAIIPWDGSLVGVPALPSGWQLCDGSVISDVRSPMHGQNTRALNGNSNATKLFIRGSTTSGTTGGVTGISANTQTSGGGNTNGLPPTETSTIPPFMEMIWIVRIF